MFLGAISINLIGSFNCSFKSNNSSKSFITTFLYSPSGGNIETFTMISSYSFNILFSSLSYSVNLGSILDNSLFNFINTIIKNVTNSTINPSKTILYIVVFCCLNGMFFVLSIDVSIISTSSFPNEIDASNLEYTVLNVL